MKPLALAFFSRRDFARHRYRRHHHRHTSSGDDLIPNDSSVSSARSHHGHQTLAITWAIRISLLKIRERLAPATRFTSNITGAGVHTIMPTNGGLPSIVKPVVIDGYSQPGSGTNTLAVGDNAVLLNELDGASANSTGLTLGGVSGGSTITGLVSNRFVNGFSDAAIMSVSSNTVVTGCFIGLDPAGTTQAGQRWRRPCGRHRGE